MLKDRLKEFLDYKGISVRSFEKECGITTGIIARFLREEKADINVSVLKSISDTYKELNIDWLMSEEGDMIENIVHEPHVSYGTNDHSKMINELISVNKNISHSNVLLSEGINDLIASNKVLINSNEKLVNKIVG